MGTNKHTAWTESTKFRPSLMNAPLSELDKAITYNKPAIVHCDGVIAYNSATGALSWDGTLRIFFCREDGQTIANTVAAGSVTLTDGKIAYVDLNETNDTVLTVSTVSISTGAASNFLANNRLVLGYRNTSSDRFYPVALRPYIGLKTMVPAVYGITYAATITVDLTQGDVQGVTLTGDPTINFSSGRDGAQVTLRLKQDATGTRVPAWGTMVRFSTDVPAPTLSTAADTTDYLTFRYHAADGKYDCMSVNRGF